MTSRGPKRAVAAALIAVATLGASPCGAATETEKKAQALFNEAMKLLAAKQYAEACDKLARSQELDPGMGTQFRLAECYEKLGRPAPAYAEYTAVAEAARAAGKRDREAFARRRAAALEPKVARLTVTVPPSVASLPGLEVTCDGIALPDKRWGAPMPVDPGDHLVSVRAPHKRPWSSKVWAEPGAKSTVVVGALEEDVVPPPPPPPPRPLWPTIVLGAAGGVGVVLGATFVGLRAPKVSAAHSVSSQISASGGNCVNGGMARFAAQCHALASDASAGDAFATASLVSFIIGGAALAGMTTYLLWPKPSPPRAGFVLAPAIGAGEAGLVAKGSF